jgi:hypothetical protein
MQMRMLIHELLDGLCPGKHPFTRSPRQNRNGPGLLKDGQAFGGGHPVRRRFDQGEGEEFHPFGGDDLASGEHPKGPFRIADADRFGFGAGVYGPVLRQPVFPGGESPEIVVSRRFGEKKRTRELGVSRSRAQVLYSPEKERGGVVAGVNMNMGIGK